MAKWVYLFSEGNATMRNLLGGKGANLAEMTNLGLPVPQGFTITTEACTQYYEDGRKINDEIMGPVSYTHLSQKCGVSPVVLPANCRSRLPQFAGYRAESPKA